MSHNSKFLVSPKVHARFPYKTGKGKQQQIKSLLLVYF